MDEPTLAEMIRDLQSDVSRILVNLDRYVTQEQRASDKEVSDLKLAAVALEQAQAKARIDALKNLLWSAVVGPVIVGVILYFLLGSKP